MAKEYLKSLVQQKNLSDQDLDRAILELQSPEMPLENLITRWQDARFTTTFPKIVQTLVSNNQYTEETRQLVFNRAFTSFMAVSWKPGANGIATGWLNFTKDGKTELASTSAKNRLTKDISDSLFRAVLGSLLLLGLKLQDRKSAIALISDTYNESEPPNKKLSFYDQLFFLIRSNSSTREWINTNNLDQGIDIGWTREITRLALFLRDPPTNEASPRFLPREFYSIKIYPAEVIDEFLNYALDYAKRLQVLYKGRKDFSGFMLELDQLAPDFCPDPNLLSKILEKRDKFKEFLDKAGEKPN